MRRLPTITPASGTVNRALFWRTFGDVGDGVVFELRIAGARKGLSTSAAAMSQSKEDGFRYEATEEAHENDLSG